MRDRQCMDALRAKILELMDGRTEKQVGEESGVGQTWINRVMNPSRKDGIKNPGLDKLGHLAKYLKVPLVELVAAAQASQPARLDAEILQSSLDDLGAALRMSRKKLESTADQAAVLKIFYDEKVLPSGDGERALADALEIIGERGVRV